MRESTRNTLVVGLVAVLLPFVVLGLMVVGELLLAAGLMGVVAVAVLVASEWRDGTDADAE